SVCRSGRAAARLAGGGREDPGGVRAGDRASHRAPHVLPAPHHAPLEATAMTAQIALVVVAALVLLDIVLSGMVRLLARLPRPGAASRATLETQLVHRAEAALVLVEEADPDPASALIIRDAAWRAVFTAPRLVGEEAADPEQRGLVESELTRALRTGLG